MPPMHMLRGADHILSVCVCLCDLDPIPSFDLSVNSLSKSINVTVEDHDKVHVRWCYKNNAECISGETSQLITVGISDTQGT